MKRSFLDIACCPECRSTLAVQPGADEEGGELRTATLRCTSCGATFPVVGGIPRFVDERNYTGSFGYQWTRFSRTQLDENLGIPLSADRFANETRWGPALHGQLVLEAGSGMGRFTRCAAETGAQVVSLDYSKAIEANYANNKHYQNIHFLQADLCRAPFRAETFDKVFCFGVLQHTPDPQKSFRCLVALTKRGGELVADVYRWTWRTVFWGQYYLRPITRRIPARSLFPIVQGYFSVVHALTGLVRPVSNHLSKVASIVLGTADYRGEFAVKPEVMREWCLLDTFDKLSPAFDAPQTEKSVAKWFEGLPAASCDVRPGYNGLEIRVRR